MRGLIGRFYVKYFGSTNKELNIKHQVDLKVHLFMYCIYTHINTHTHRERERERVAQSFSPTAAVSWLNCWMVVLSRLGKCQQLRTAAQNQGQIMSVKIGYSSNGVSSKTVADKLLMEYDKRIPDAPCMEYVPAFG